MKAGKLRVQGDIEPEATCAAGATPVSGVYGRAYKATLNSPARERPDKTVIIHREGTTVMGVRLVDTLETRVMEAKCDGDG